MADTSNSTCLSGAQPVSLASGFSCPEGFYCMVLSRFNVLLCILTSFQAPGVTSLNQCSAPHHPTVSYDDFKAVPTYASHRKATWSPSSVAQDITVHLRVHSSFRVRVDTTAPWER
jgi:hypothetical protein